MWGASPEEWRVGYRAAISTHLLSRSPDSLPNKLHPSAISRLFPGSSQAIPHRRVTAPGPPAPVALFCSSSPARAYPPARQSPFPRRGALSLDVCRLPGEVTGGLRPPLPGRPSARRRAGGAAVRGALWWEPEPERAPGPHSPGSGAERSCCLCVAAACGAPRGAQRPLTSGSVGSKKVGF